jgi:hypothetical protein
MVMLFLPAWSKHAIPRANFTLSASSFGLALCLDLVEELADALPDGQHLRRSHAGDDLFGYSKRRRECLLVLVGLEGRRRILLGESM